MTNGGKRPGAGRPKAHAPSFTEQAQAFRVALINAVSADQDAIIRGIILQLKRGDSRIVKEVLDRLLGRVKESYELTGADGAPIQIQQITGMQIIPYVNGTTIPLQKSKTDTSG